MIANKKYFRFMIPSLSVVFCHLVTKELYTTVRNYASAYTHLRYEFYNFLEVIL